MTETLTELNSPPLASASPPTLSDVAKEAGVSLATASRVINGSTRKVAAPYRERVEAAAVLLGYTPNLSAQATARGSSSSVALLVADVADPYFGQIASAVVSGADAAGLMVTISMTSRDEQREAGLIRVLRGQRPRGLILAASRTSEPAALGIRAELEAFVAGGGRLVTIGRGSVVGTAIPIDNEGGAAKLGALMSKSGYRNAILLAAEDGILTSDDRIRGVSETFTRGGGTITAVYRGNFSRESGRQMMDAALQSGVAPGSIVFAVSDIVAIGAMTAIRASGRGIGADIALCGFDDIEPANDVHPGLTTVRIPLDIVGEMALDCVITGERPVEPIILEVVVRGTTPLCEG